MLFPYLGVIDKPDGKLWTLSRESIRQEYKNADLRSVTWQCPPGLFGKGAQYLSGLGVRSCLDR